jgi:Family of unknown function (DUF6325)
VSTEPKATGPVDEMGPIDYLIVEFPGRRAPGAGLPLFLDLVDRGIVRILDLVIIRKEPDGTVVRQNLADLSPELAAFEGVSSGLLDQHDIDNTAAVIARDSAAGLLVYENRWAAPFVAAVRREGAALVATGRLPLEAVLAQLDATEAGRAGG